MAFRLVKCEGSAIELCDGFLLYCLSNNDLQARCLSPSVRTRSNAANSQFLPTFGFVPSTFATFRISETDDALGHGAMTQLSTAWSTAALLKLVTILVFLVTRSFVLPTHAGDVWN